MKKLHLKSKGDVILLYIGGGGVAPTFKPYDLEEPVAEMHIGDIYRCIGVDKAFSHPVASLCILTFLYAAQRAPQNPAIHR